jgi:glucokinase
MHIIADVGGTKMRLARVSIGEPFGEPVIIQTPPSYQQALSAFVEIARRLAGSERIETIAVGVPFSFSRKDPTLAKSTNLPDWSGKRFDTDLASALHAQVRMENDVALVGLGEAMHGAGRGASIVMYMTVSTGVNGVRIVDKRIDPSAQGFETGDQFISIDPPRRLAEMISGHSIQERFGMNPRELGKDHVVWSELANILAFGLCNGISHWSPDRVVLGGSMFNDIGIPIDEARQRVTALLNNFMLTPEIVHASLGDLGGLWGALALLDQEA